MNNTLKEKRDLILAIKKLPQDTGSYAEAARLRGIPAGPCFPSETGEETFGEWLSLILAGEIKPESINEYRSTYHIIQELELARNIVREAIAAEPGGIWAMMDAMRHMFNYEAAELLADYLLAYDDAGSCVIHALNNMIPGANELNPDNLSDIADVLNKSEDEQLWFFLDDCIPHDKKDIRILFQGNTGINEDGSISNAREMTTSITDRLYFGDTSLSALEDAGLSYMQPYIPLLKHCYRPYDWSLSVPNLTEEQKQKLQILVERNDCAGTVVDLSNPGATGVLKEDAVTVPAVFSILFGSIYRTANGWLYSVRDKLDFDEE